MSRNYFFIDAETDGLYGKFLTVAVLIADESGEVLKEFYFGLPQESMNVGSVWVKENVIPYLGEYDVVIDEEALVNETWKIWGDYGINGGGIAIADVTFPVEMRLFQKAIEGHPERHLRGPFPFLDLASMLVAKGYEPDVERLSVVKDKSIYSQHNALSDVRMTREIFFKLMEDK